MKMEELKNKCVVVGKTSITCKDEHGKTCGIVRNVKSWKILQPREIFDFAKVVRDSGIRSAGLCDNIIVDGKQLYYLHDLKPLEAVEKYFKDFPGEQERYNLRVSIAEAAPNYNIIVIPCYVN